MNTRANPLQFLAAPAVGIALMMSGQADVITHHDNDFDFAGRMAGGDANVNDANWWSIHANGNTDSAQQSYASVETSLVAALDADSGGLGAGDSYQINSATISFSNNQYGSGTAYLATSTVAFTAARTPTTLDGSTLWPDGNEPGTSASWTGNTNSATSAYLPTIGSFTTTGSVGVAAFVDGVVNGRLFLSSSPAGNGGAAVSTVENVNWGTGAHWSKTGDDVYLTVDYEVIPEPTAGLLAVLSMGAFLRRRRQS